MLNIAQVPQQSNGNNRNFCLRDILNREWYFSIELLVSNRSLDTFISQEVYVIIAANLRFLITNFLSLSFLIMVQVLPALPWHIPHLVKYTILLLPYASFK